MSSSPFSLTGKTILVTGASSGIGRACAIEISKADASRVILTARDENRLQETVGMMDSKTETSIVKADFSNYEEIENLIKEIPYIDGLVLCAGINRMKTISFIKESDIKDIFDVNCFSVINFVRLLLRRKKLNKSCSLVFIGSISGTSNFAVGNAVYGASKNALSAYMKYAALELAPKGIRCNAINPGRIETPLIQENNLEEETLKRDIELYPLKRYGKPEEVAFAAIYLLSDAASWVTGSEITVDGGRSLV